MVIYDLDYLETHGGSLRIYVGHKAEFSANRGLGEQLKANVHMDFVIWIFILTGLQKYKNTNIALSIFTRESIKSKNSYRMEQLPR